MSVELIVVIIIITSIVSIVAAGVFYLLSTQKKSRITTEYTSISEAVTKFQIANSTLPGLLPAADLTGAFNNTELAQNAGVLTTAVKSIVTEQIGQSLAWRELYLNDKSAVSAEINPDFDDTPALVGCQSYKTLVDNKVIPMATFDKALAWVLVSSSAHKGIVANAARKNTWPDTRLRLVLIRYGSLTGTGSSASQCLDFEGTTQELGALSPNDTYSLFQKFNATDPSAGYMAIAENYGTQAASPAPVRCTNVGVVAGSAGVLGSAATLAQLTASRFNSSDDASGLNGCIVHFAVGK